MKVFQLFHIFFHCSLTHAQIKEKDVVSAQVENMKTTFKEAYITRLVIQNTFTLLSLNVSR